MSLNGGSSTSTSKSQPTLQGTIDKAAERYLPPLAGLEAAEKAMWLDDSRRLAADERKTVRRYREAKLKGKLADDPTEGEMGGIIVTGDIHADASRRGGVVEQILGEPAPPGKPPKTGLPTWVKWLGAGLLAAAAGTGGVLGTKAVLDQRTPPSTTSPDRWNEYDLQVIPGGALE